MMIKCLILDDDTLLRNCVEETYYYSENKLLPVYKMRLTKGVPTDKVAEILIWLQRPEQNSYSGAHGCGEECGVHS